MEDKLKNKLKTLLPYIIINAIIFLLLPLLMGNKTGVATYLIQVVVFPLTAVGCSIHYKRFKKETDVYICFVAPLFYAVTALIYGMWSVSWYTVLIYIAAYFLSGYLGLLLCDMMKTDRKKGSDRSASKRFSQRPSRVNVKEDAKDKQNFAAEDPSEDMSLDVSTTDDDIEEIFNRIHNKNG